MLHFTLALNDAFRDAFYKYKNDIALHFGDAQVTYEQLRLRSNRFAHALNDLQLPSNSRVALFMSNRLEFVYAQMGGYQAGVANIPLNDMLGENEIKYILKDCHAKVLIVEEQFFEKVQHIRSELPNLTTIVGISEHQVPEGFISWEEFQGSQSEEDLTLTIPQEDIAQSVYTGGTTGNPKGVLHSYQTTITILFAVILENEIAPEEKILLTSPLPHAAGISLQAGLLRGSEIYIEKKFSEELILNHVETNKVTYIMAVPTMIYRIIDFMEGKEYDISSIRTIVYGTAPIARERLKQALDIFGPVFIQTYGLTESPGVATKLSKKDHHIEGANLKHLTSCGRPTMFTRVKIVDEQGDELERGMEGEIIISSPANMVGYYNLPEMTAESLKDGWMHTGDIGYMDEENYVYVLDRKKDMIISGGMNVYSSEVENELQKHPGIRQVAVIGVPDPDWGEAVNAFIIPKDTSLTADQLKVWSKDKLSAYKRPKNYEIVGTLPLTPYGKIDKKKLREPYWDTVDRRI
ncbi:AMP-dependent synthetase [Sporosarcina sp. BI001-red]|uniref:class I adenylate-forming enzyme family protein n=1 Tax=Sporosarcina sp. BI001-red TaxID=2282866 RepID=UPI000E236592|nr:AMP-binding protein [Sporosarcina sp. BI001-red]REB08746.1 AMP-dependent synthetase [Sporosarcina sp. BI001-red]